MGIESGEKTSGPSPLRLFGDAIVSAREKIKGINGKSLTQQGLMRLLRGRLGEGISQSYVSRLEQGRVTNPSAELVVALSEVLAISRDELVGLLIQDKYKIPPERLFSHRKDTLSFEALMSWIEVTTVTDAWMVLPNLGGDYLKVFWATVEVILQREASVTIFVPTELLRSHQYYATRFSQTGELKASLSLVPLTFEQCAVSITDFVIVNLDVESVTRLKPEGYVVVYGLEGRPGFATGMSYRDIVGRAATLLRMRNEQIIR